MADDADLLELSKLAVSGRRVMVAVLVVLGACILGAALLGTLPLAVLEKLRILIVAAVIVLCGFGIGLAMRVKTPPSAFPTLRVMRDRPNDVAFIVDISRGASFLAVTNAAGDLLAKPVRLNGSSREAAKLAQKLCPNARVCKIADDLGLASLAKLARKATKGT